MNKIILCSENSVLKRTVSKALLNTLIVYRYVTIIYSVAFPQLSLYLDANDVRLCDMVPIFETDVTCLQSLNTYTVYCHTNQFINLYRRRHDCLDMPVYQQHRHGFNPTSWLFGQLSSGQPKPWQ